MYTLQTRKSDTLQATMAAGATSATLTNGAFGTPTGKQIITIDYDVAAKAADFEVTLAGTAITEMVLLNGPDVQHEVGAKVAMCFVDEHYARVANRTLGYAQKTDTQLSIGAETDLTSLSVTVTVPTGGARIKITAFINASDGLPSKSVFLYLKEGTTNLQTTGGTTLTQNIGIGLTATWVGTVAAGSHTYKAVGSGSGTSNFYGHANNPAFILVENIE